MTIAEGHTDDVGQALEERQGQVPQMGKTLQQEIRELTPQLTAALPPGIITPDRFVRTVLTTIRKNPELLNCTRESFLGSMLTVAQLGLEIDPTLGQAYLIPYRDRKTNRLDCTLQIGYKGYIELAWRGGITIESNDVREFDLFNFERGTNPHLTHSWKLGDERGEIVGYYATATFPDGRVRFYVMDLADIEKRRARSQVRSDKGPWKTDAVAMSKKTAIRAMMPQIPLNTELSRALEVDEGIVHLKGTEATVSYPDPADQLVDQGRPALSIERADAEEELVGLIESAIDQRAAEGWLMLNFGPIPNLSDEQLAAAATAMDAWLTAPPDQEPAGDGDPGPSEPPEGYETSSGPGGAVIDAEAVSPAPGDKDDQAIYASTVAMVNGMPAAKVRETIRLFATEDDVIPSALGAMKLQLIQILNRERKAGNQAAENLF